MALHVLFEIISRGVIRLADRTLMFCLLIVGLLVSVQTADQRECFTTYGALVWFLTCVVAHVHVQSDF